MIGENIYDILPKRENKKETTLLVFQNLHVVFVNISYQKRNKKITIKEKNETQKMTKEPKNIFDEVTVSWMNGGD